MFRPELQSASRGSDKNITKSTLHIKNNTNLSRIMLCTWKLAAHESCCPDWEEFLQTLVSRAAKRRQLRQFRLMRKILNDS